MAYVQPNGTIQLFRGLGLTNEYVDTIWFPSKSAQDGMFSQIVRKFFTNQMYSRVNKNTVRVNCVADEIQDCDYMRFQNTRNNISKWYYCFINEINYINEQVTEIVYEIDEVQTWFLDGNFGKCFVERNHGTTDTIGDNIVPEPFSIEGDTVSNVPIRISATGTKYLLVLGAVDLAANFTDLNQNEYGGLASTVHYLLFDSANLHTFLKACKFTNGLLDGLFSTGDIWCILGVYVVPAPFFSDGTSRTLKGASCVVMSQFPYAVVDYTTKPTEETARHGNSADGYYSPMNNKMFTYPFYYMKMSTPLNEQIVKYENFFGNNQNCYFTIKTCCNPEPQIVCMPINYNGESFDYKYSLTISGFPMLTVYQSNMIGELVAKAIKGLAAASAVAIASVGSAAASATAEGTGEIIGSSALKGVKAGLASSNPTRISAENGIKSGGKGTDFATLFASSGIGAVYDPVFQFNVYNMCLRAQVAQIYDEYMSRYGYAQNRVMVPVIHARQKWTYVKTRNCSFNGYCPSSSAKVINTVMNNGVTWWDYRNAVGSYGNFSNPLL